jgi:hypothetical protein
MKPEDKVKMQQAIEAFWVCAEHNALHFGQNHNTVVLANSAASTLRQLLETESVQVPVPHGTTTDHKVAAELRRLQEVNTELLERLKGAREWHNGDKWRDGCTSDQRAAWELQRDLLDATIAKATRGAV